jgi:hypothetical protein
MRRENSVLFPLSPCGRGCPSQRVRPEVTGPMTSSARAGEGSLQACRRRPHTRLAALTRDFATLSHKGRGEELTQASRSALAVSDEVLGENGVLSTRAERTR